MQEERKWPARGPFVMNTLCLLLYIGLMALLFYLRPVRFQGSYFWPSMLPMLLAALLNLGWRIVAARGWESSYKAKKLYTLAHMALAAVCVVLRLFSILGLFPTVLILIVMFRAWGFWNPERFKRWGPRLFAIYVLLTVVLAILSLLVLGLKIAWVDGEAVLEAYPITEENSPMELFFNLGPQTTYNGLNNRDMNADWYMWGYRFSDAVVCPHPAYGTGQGLGAKGEWIYFDGDDYGSMLEMELLVKTEAGRGECILIPGEEGYSLRIKTDWYRPAVKCRVATAEEAKALLCSELYPQGR